MPDAHEMYKNIVLNVKVQISELQMHASVLNDDDKTAYKHSLAEAQI